MQSCFRHEKTWVPWSVAGSITVEVNRLTAAYDRDGLDLRSARPGDAVVDRNGRCGLVVAAWRTDPVLGQTVESIFRWRWWIVFGDVLEETWTTRDCRLLTPRDE